MKEAEGKTGKEAAEIYASFLSSTEDQKVRWNYVYSLYEAELYDAALEEIDKGISLYPENIRFLYIKSLVYRKLELPEDEISVLEAIKDINPGNIEVRKRLLSLYSLFDHEKAKKEAKDILLFDSKNLEALEYLAKYSSFYSRLYESSKPKEEKIEEEKEADESIEQETDESMEQETDESSEKEETELTPEEIESKQEAPLEGEEKAKEE